MATCTSLSIGGGSALYWILGVPLKEQVLLLVLEVHYADVFSFQVPWYFLYAIHVELIEFILFEPFCISYKRTKFTHWILKKKEIITYLGSVESNALQNMGGWHKLLLRYQLQWPLTFGHHFYVHTLLISYLLLLFNYNNLKNHAKFFSFNSKMDTNNF